MNWFKLKKAKFLWKWDIQWLKARATLAQTALGQQFPFLLFLGGIGFLGNGLYLIYRPLMWIFLGAVMVYVALGKERIDKLQSEKAELEELRKMASKGPINSSASTSGQASFSSRRS